MSEIKFGVGVTTYNRPQHYALWVQQFIQHSPKDRRWVVYDDSKERKGIAYGKNHCLLELRDCDYIFLFDDDCFPIKEGWLDFFIEAHKVTGQHHFLYLTETTSIKKIGQNQSINIYSNCGGAFMFLTKEVIEKAGGFSKEYGRYGFEHAGYSTRIHKAGLTTMGMYLCPEGAGDYIYAMDYDFHLPFNRQVNHSSSISPMEAMEGIKMNLPIYKKDIETIYQPI